MKDKFILLPRILAIVFIAFITLFSLDVFGSGTNIWDAILGFILHSIPSIALIILSIVFWKKPLVMGIIFIATGAFLSVQSLIGFFSALSQTGEVYGFLISGTIVTIALPAIIIGILFIIANKRQKKSSSQ